MYRVPVSSQNLKSVGYDLPSATLEVAFHKGGIYQYYGVPAVIHQQLLGAVSKGSYLAKAVKGHFRYRKVG